MRRSTERILTTHVGSLIRPAPLLPFIRAKQTGQPYDAQAYAACLAGLGRGDGRNAGQAGIDIPSDGEFGKSISWSQYALERLSGFERRPGDDRASTASRAAPIARASPSSTPSSTRPSGPPATALGSVGEAVCVAPIRYTGQAEVQRDIDNFKAALKHAPAWPRASCRWPRRRA